MQALTEAIYPKIKAAQPSKNAFFSRSHGFIPPEITVDDVGEYFWFINWKEFSKKRFAFASVYPFICITDVANFFDNVDYIQLRNVLTSTSVFDEVILDVLFMVIDRLSWRPDYLPSQNKGLPQVNFDAPRLLAHSFLFEADKYIKNVTKDQFVRWVDDITIPAESLEDGKLILRDLDEILMTRGLRLNSGKTVILSGAEGKKYLWADENRFLSVVEARIERLAATGASLSSERIRLRRRFRRFFKMAPVGYWDKVLKRYFTIFAKLGDKYLEKEVPSILQKLPQVRDAIFRYYMALGPSKVRLEHISQFLLDGHALDDVSVFAAGMLLADWEIKPKSPIIRNIRELAWELGSKQVWKSHMYLTASIWLAVKYGSAKMLSDIIMQNENTWRVSSYLSRQVAAATPKLRQSLRIVKKIEETIVKHGELEAMSVIIHLRSLRAGPYIHKDIVAYLRHNKAPRPGFYPLGKIIIALDILTSPYVGGGARKSLAGLLRARVRDPVYLHHLSRLAV